METEISRINIENRVVASLIGEASSVLDLGCGNGDLLYFLSRNKGCKVRGIEIDEQAIYQCISKGLSVLHGDIDSSLNDYPDNTFDFVVLNQSFQQVKNPDNVLQESLRIGKEVIVSFPNFTFLSARYQIFFKGRTPITPSLPYEWHNTPNLHFLSISDFIIYCRKRNLDIKKTIFLNNDRIIRLLPNLFAQIGIFLIRNGKVK